MLANNATYERITSVAGTGAVQARIEKMDNGNYILVILWGLGGPLEGYTLSGYPPAAGNNDLARDLSKALIDQFRWMTKDEIETAKNAPPPPATPLKPNMGPGREF